MTSQPRSIPNVELRLGWVIVYVDEPTIASAFYERALGLRGVRRAPLDGQPANIEITLVADDVDAAYARAVEAGCTPLALPKDEPRGQRVSWVRDPFGTLVEIATPL